MPQTTDDVDAKTSECDNCGIEYLSDCEWTHREGVCYGCWFEQASLSERCEAESNRPGPLQRIANEALRSPDAEQHLLTLVGDPSRSLHDRTDADTLLSGAVSVETLIDAQVRCPECREEEVFHIDKETGDVSCHCGEEMPVPEYPEER